jgi:hypothetical protein
LDGVTTAAIGIRTRRAVPIARSSLSIGVLGALIAIADQVSRRIMHKALVSRVRRGKYVSEVARHF